MRLLEKILVPVDIENETDSSAEAAILLAKKFHSKIILLQVLPKEAKSKDVQPLIDQFIDNELNSIINKFKQSDINVETIVQYGNFFDQIITISEDENVNLILKQNQLKHIKNGASIDILSEKLLRKSQKPVWIINPDSQLIPENMLCPVDFSDSSKRALNNAIKIARVFKSKLTILHVFEPLLESFTSRLNIDYIEENNRLERNSKKQLDKYLEQFNFTDVKIEINISRGKVYEKILEMATEKKTDLIFIGATGKTFLKRVLLGSVTEEIIRSFPTSIVITKDENILNLRLESNISNLEKHLNQAKKFEETGSFDEAIEQLKICLQISNLHLPTLNRLVMLYKKTGKHDLASDYKDKMDEILTRLWDKSIKIKIRKRY